MTVSVGQDPTRVFPSSRKGHDLSSGSIVEPESTVKDRFLAQNNSNFGTIGVVNGIPQTERTRKLRPTLAMLISWVSKLIRRYLLLSLPEQACCRAEHIAAGPLGLLNAILVENYTLRLWGYMLRNVTCFNHDQSLGTDSEDAHRGGYEGRADAATSLLSPVHLVSKRIIPVAKVLGPVSMFAWISYTSGHMKQ